MSDETTDLPPAPDPVTEPREPSPGGPDAITGVGGDGPTTTEPRDLPPALNAVNHQLPELETTEDTDTEATKGNPEVPPTRESPA